MKYFGKKSLSSFLDVLLHIIWGITLLIAVIAPVFVGVVIALSTPDGVAFIERTNKDISIHKSNYSECFNENSESDKKSWKEFSNLPLMVKLIMLPYLEAILILMLLIIKKSRELFKNFKRDVVFNRSNVELISKISKMLIVFSIITFSISSLIISIILLMICEIIKNGAVLQEEHDLTV